MEKSEILTKIEMLPNYSYENENHVYCHENPS